ATAMLTTRIESPDGRRSVINTRYAPQARATSTRCTPFDNHASVATTTAVAVVVTTNATSARGEERTAGPGHEGRHPLPGPAVEPTAVEGPCGCDRRTGLMARRRRWTGAERAR